MEEKEKEEEKRPVGRPTIYEPKFCEMLIEHMAKGLSFESFAGFIGVSKQTLYDWVEKHAEFLDAKNLATSKCRLWWEQTGISGLWNQSESESEGNSRRTSSKSFNTGVWVFNMKNRFKEEWKEKHESQEELGQEQEYDKCKLVVYLPKNGREAIEADEEKPKEKRSKNIAKKKKKRG